MLNLHFVVEKINTHVAHYVIFYLNSNILKCFLKLEGSSCFHNGFLKLEMLSLGLHVHDEGIENLGCMSTTKSCAWEISFWPYARLNARGV